MSRSTIVTKEPVVLDGYQAVMKPSQYGHTLSAIVDQEIIDKLEAERPALLDYGKNKLKSPSRGRANPEPWEEVTEGKYQVKFSWNDENRPAVVDSEGTLITNEDTPLYGGSKVNLAFHQKPYILKDGVTYGTSLKLVGVQVIALNTSAGVDTGDMDEASVADLFGKTAGFKAGDPNITSNDDTATDDDF